MRRLASILILLPTLVYGIVPWFADWNETHLFHPQWTPHSKFHMMWLLCVNSLMAGFALYSFSKGLRLQATCIGLLVFGGFWIASVSRTLYGGALGDDGGYRSLMGLDLNTLTFGICTTLLVLGLVAERRSRPKG